MSAYAELSQPVRQSMRKWWNSTGGMLLIAMLLLWAVYVGVALPNWPHLSAMQYGRPVTALISTTCVYLAVPVIWLWAAIALLRTPLPLVTSSASATGRELPPALYLLCVQQGLGPLAVSWCLGLVTYLIHHHLQHPVTFSSLDLIDGAADAMTAKLRYIPIMLVALSILILTRRAHLSIGLIAAKQFSDFAWLAIDSHNHGPWNPRLAWEVSYVLASALVLFVLLQGLAVGKLLASRLTYWLLIGGLVLPPLVRMLVRNPSWPELTLDRVALGSTYLLYGHGQIVNWLMRHFTGWFPPEHTLLAFASPAVPLLWLLVWCGALFAGLYWMLGRSWQEKETTPPASEPVPELA